MKKVNLLSKAEMRNVLGGLFPIQLMFNNCVAEATGGMDPNTTEYQIIYNMCENEAKNFCAREVAMGRECWLDTAV